MGVFVRHEGCEKCGSSDAKAVYADGSQHCFSCSYTVPSEDHMKEQPRVKSSTKKENEMQNNKFQKTDESKLKPVITKEQVQEIKSYTTLEGSGYRGIKDWVLKYFGVRMAHDEDDNVVAQYYPVTYDGTLSGYKVRNHPKTFSSIGRTGKECDLFGQFRFTSPNKYVLLVGGECFDAETEVLTEKGFVKFDDLSKTEVVAQVDPVSNEISYVKPQRFVEKEYIGKMVKIRSKFLDVFCTENHNLFYRKNNGAFEKKPAKDTVPATMKMHTSVKHNGIGTGLTEDQISLVLAVCADSKIDTRVTGRKVAHLEFSKKRKIQRMIELLNNLDICYTSYTNTYASGKTYTTFNFDLPSWISSKIIPSEWITKTTLAEKCFIVDEMSRWDGNSVAGRNMVEFSSKLKTEADVIYAIAVTAGFHTSVDLRSNSLGQWYRVRISYDKNSVSTQGLDSKKEFVDYNGKVYCVTVPSGLIVVRRNGKTLVVGNCDQLAAYQMLREYQVKKGTDNFDAIPVVSPTIGETGSAQQLALQYEFFDKFEKIVLCYDNDEAGEKATEKALVVLPKGKVHVMKLRHKDPNDYLLKNDDAKFVQDFYAAEKYIPTGIVGSHEISDAMREELVVEKVPLPPFMHKLQSMMAGGIPLGRIVNLGSASGTGKSTIVDELIYYWIFNSPHRLGVVTLEATVGQYGIKLLSRHISKKLELLDQSEALDLINTEKVKDKEKELFCTKDQNPRFYLVDDRGGEVSNIQDAIENLIISCNCKVIVCDPVSDVIASLPLDEQENFMSWQKGMVKSHNVTFINVCHTRKTSSGQKAGSTGADLHEEDLIGSSSLYKSAACNLMFSRDKESEDEIERNTTTMKATKIRWTGKTGIAGKYYYECETHTLHDLDDWLNANGGYEFK